jgi:hypothetical protein
LARVEALVAAASAGFPDMVLRTFKLNGGAFNAALAGLSGPKHVHTSRVHVLKNAAFFPILRSFCEEIQTDSATSHDSSAYYSVAFFSWGKGGKRTSKNTFF